MKTNNFVDKYFPKNIKELMGLDENVSKIIHFLNNFNKVKKKALLLVGPAGTGKTSSIFAIAKTLNYDVIEINASDKRNANSVKSIIGQACKQGTLFGNQKIILIDEVDGINGNNDRGGVRELNKIIKNTSFPIIMTANNEYSSRLKSLKTKATVIKFKKRAYWDVYRLLKRISEIENKNLSPVSLKRLASMAQGDVRSGFNDLQTITCKEDVDNLYNREKEVNVFDTLKIIFKSKTLSSLLGSLNNVSDLRYTMLCVGDNIPIEYEKREEIIEAFNYFSLSDVFLGRMFKRNHFRLGYVYSKLFISLGIGLSKNEMYRKFSRFIIPPFVIRFLGSSKSKRNEMNELTTIIGKETHCSIKKAKKEYVAFYKIWNKLS